jgi:hypothetical protein
VRTQVAFGVEVSEFQRAEPDPRNAIGYLASQELLATQWRLIPLREQQLGEVRTILPGDPGNERLLHAPVSKTIFTWHVQPHTCFLANGKPPTKARIVAAYPASFPPTLPPITRVKQAKQTCARKPNRAFVGSGGPIVEGVRDKPHPLARLALDGTLISG